jgi:acetyl esterase/lipase
VDYRLAGEFPYPVGPDDRETAACWLINKAEEIFGAKRLRAVEILPERS